MSGGESQLLLRESNTTGQVEHHGITLNASYDSPSRREIRHFLSSKYGHYAVLLLVSLDVSCIFADFLIALYVCEHKCEKGEILNKNFDKAQDALGIVSLIFSCLFLAELVLSIWAFGFSFFKSKFHCFDATIIIAGFIIDVCLKGVLEEAGSIVVFLRLWRVVKIVDEFSAGASDQMELLEERIDKLTTENQDLKKELRSLKGD